MLAQGLPEKLGGRGTVAGNDKPHLPTKAEYDLIVRENEALKAQVAYYAKEKRKRHSFVKQPSREYHSVGSMDTDVSGMGGAVIPEYEPCNSIAGGDEEDLVGNGNKPQKWKTGLGSKMSFHVMKQGKIGRRHLYFASENTGKLLNMLHTPRENLPEKVMKRLEKNMTTPYLASNAFKTDLMALCDMARPLLESEPRCIKLQSPCHVFGDIHGNIEELQFFSDMIWMKGVHLTAGIFLFLGDYVDRGMYSVECVAYLLAMKVRNPTKVYLLRGNHELRDVNSWADFYGERCLLSQCNMKYGNESGMVVWEAINTVFDRLPLAAIIDEDIFCLHGGIPRPVNRMNEIDLIMQIPCVASISPPYAFELPLITKVAYDCLWSDPVKPEEEGRMDYTGFGSNPRGKSATCYGKAAVDSFLERNSFSYIIRAHEKTKDGMSLSKDARLITVFSTSKDHNLGGQALAACLLIDDHRIEVITKDPGYERIRRIFTESSCSINGFDFPRSGSSDISNLECEQGQLYFDFEDSNQSEFGDDVNVDASVLSLHKQNGFMLAPDYLKTDTSESALCNDNKETHSYRKTDSIPMLVVPDDDLSSSRYNLRAMMRVKASSATLSLTDNNKLCDDTPRCLDIDHRDSLNPDDFKELRGKSPPVILKPISLLTALPANNDIDVFDGKGQTYGAAAAYQNGKNQKQATRPKSREGGNRILNVMSTWVSRK